MLVPMMISRIIAMMVSLRVISGSFIATKISDSLCNPVAFFENHGKPLTCNVDPNYGKWSSRRPIGRSNYDIGWRCTTVCNLEQTNGHICIGALIAGKALDPDTAKKAKGGARGELMLAMGC